MKFKEWNKMYSNPDNFYDNYLISPEGTQRWEEAYEVFPDYNSGDDDSYDATDYIIEGMKYWMYNQCTDEKENSKFDKWFEENQTSLFESIMAGLT